MHITEKIMTKLYAFSFSIMLSYIISSPLTSMAFYYVASAVNDS